MQLLSAEKDQALSLNIIPWSALAVRALPSTWTMLQLSGAQIFFGIFWHQVLGLWSPEGLSM